MYGADGAQAVERDALGVFSDSQLNALSLAAFLARCRLQRTPFVVLDDPLQAGDDEHRPTFIDYVIGNASDLLRKISSAARARFDEFDKQRDARLARERDLKNLQNNLRNSEQEATALGLKADEQKQKADDFGGEAAKTGTRIAELEGLLKAFDRVGEELREQQELKQRHSTGQQLYLGAKPT